MKRFGFLSAMLAIVLVFGLTLASCGNNDGNNNTPGGNGGGPESNPYALSPNTWINGSITSSTAGAALWYSINVTSGTRYYIWVNDDWRLSGSNKTLQTKIIVHNPNGTPANSIGSVFWDTPFSYTATSTGTVKIKVGPYYTGDTGTFAIVYSTSNTRP